jgi:hypothetical protein
MDEREVVPSLRAIVAQAELAQRLSARSGELKNAPCGVSSKLWRARA